MRAHEQIHTGVIPGLYTYSVEEGLRYEEAQRAMEARADASSGPRAGFLRCLLRLIFVKSHRSFFTLGPQLRFPILHSALLRVPSPRSHVRCVRAHQHHELGSVTRSSTRVTCAIPVAP
eukprot:5875056-Pleurochrysis_carterae.AAC.1